MHCFFLNRAEACSGLGGGGQGTDGIKKQPTGEGEMGTGGGATGGRNPWRGGEGRHPGTLGQTVGGREVGEGDQGGGVRLTPTSRGGGGPGLVGSMINVMDPRGGRGPPYLTP